KAIPGYRANVRESDNSVLSIVGDRYRVVQNTDAFRFTDELIGGDVHYETAASLREGRQIWLLAKMPERKIVGDAVEPYLCFTNSHDGGGAVRVCMTPVRVVCNNTLNLALDTAQRTWSMRHTESINGRLMEARDCLLRADKYMEDLAEYAEAAKAKQIRDDEIKEILNQMFPLGVSEDADEKKVEKAKKRQEKMKTEYMVCYFMPDLANLRGTAWGAINAMSDFVSHNMPHVNRKNYAANNWDRIMTGHAVMDKMVDLCMAR
ncbi:MAG: DUF945 domain-containing protein, partial [Oscillibacter sp.]|nr:DUF945 domain-containing protein [Oscillibacter sp.]